MLNLLLSGMTTYGPLVLGLAMLPAAVGVPVPTGTLLIAAGAFVRQGLMDGRSLFLLAWIGALLSDALSYGLGRWAGQWAHRRLPERYTATWHRAEGLFAERGGWAVFLTSWLIRGLALPTNLIAGSSEYPFWNFVSWDAVGKVLWVLLHAGLGYLFADRWPWISRTLGDYGRWLVLAILLGLGIYLLYRLWARRNRAD